MMAPTVVAVVVQVLVMILHSRKCSHKVDVWWMVADLNLRKPWGRLSRRFWTGDSPKGREHAGEPETIS